MEITAEQQLFIDKVNTDVTAKMEAYKVEADASAKEAAKAEANALIEAFKTSQPEMKDNPEFIALSQKVAAMDIKETVHVNESAFDKQFTANKDSLIALAGDKSSRERISLTLDINAVATDMGQTIAPNYPEQPFRDKLDVNIGTIIKFGRPILDAIPSESTDTDLYEEMYETTPEGAPAFVAELTDVPKISFDWDEENFKAQRVGVNTVISERVMMFQKELYNKISGLVNRELYDKIATELISGDGTGANISGLKTLGTAFSAAATGIAAGELGVLTAVNKIEILYAAITQLQQGGFNVSKILLNPADITAMRLSQSGAGEFSSPSQIEYLLSLAIPSQKITSGEFILFDDMYIRQKYPKQITVEMFRDFTQGKNGSVGMVAAAYLALVRNKNYAQSICFGDFTSAALDLNA